MTNENELAIPQVAGSIQRNDDDFDSLARGAKYLTRLVLTQGSTEYVKAGKIGVGRWGHCLDKERIEDLSDCINVQVCDWRSKAMKMKGGEPELISYDRKSPEFVMIEKLAETSKFGDDETGLIGPEFLFWVPTAKNGRGAFITFFCSSATTRKEAPNVRAYLEKPATLRTKYIKKPKFSWHAFTTASCTQPIPAPTPEALLEAITMFRNPPKDSEKELAPEADGGGVDR